MVSHVVVHVVIDRTLWVDVSDDTKVDGGNHEQIVGETPTHGLGSHNLMSSREDGSCCSTDNSGELRLVPGLRRDGVSRLWPGKHVSED